MWLKLPTHYRSFILIGAGILFLWLSFSAGSGEKPLSPARSLSDLEPHYRASVIRGWRFFQTSFARDGMSCVDCHLQPDSKSTWARAYPKVEVFDGTPYRVKALRQVVLEALEKHTDLPEGRRAALAEDLVAYIAWRGEGQVLRPGFSKRFPPPSVDLAELQAASQRGASLFEDHAFGPCAKCHSPGDKADSEEKIALGQAAATFPGYVVAARQVMSLETFLAWHLAVHDLGGYSPESQKIADLAAYLARQAAGKRVRTGRVRKGIGENP
jgi:cytochrome c